MCYPSGNGGVGHSRFAPAVVNCGVARFAGRGTGVRECLREGDMTVGALADAGADLAVIIQTLESISRSEAVFRYNA